MYQRRDVLRLTLGGAAGLTAFSTATSGFGADTPPAPSTVTAPPGPPAVTAPPSPGVILGAPVDFRASMVLDMARALSKQPFKPVATDLPDPFKSLSYEQYEAIRLKPSARIWASEAIGYAIEPLHRGFQFDLPIQLNLVADGRAQRLVYDTSMFDFGKLAPSPRIGDIGFSGFRVLATRTAAGKGAGASGATPAITTPNPTGEVALREIAAFQGSNFFRALAEGQVAGLMARALALKIGDPKGEEMPIFRSIWIERPSLVTATLVIHAVIDSDSVAAAFRFTLRTGEATIIDTECTLFPRAAVDNFGLASMSATHLLGFMDHKRFDDYRPNVGEVCGLQMLTGASEWVWRPVTNRDSLQISTFVDDKPRGFGCLIRDRAFGDYADEENHWEKRPSLWIEPIGDWTAGGVQLIEIPSQSDANDNILCFWRPREPLKAGSEVSFAYRQFWCWDPPARPDLARAMRSRAGGGGRRWRFFVEFEGDVLGDPERAHGLAPALTTSAGTVTLTRTFTDTNGKACRVLFEIDPGNAVATELRLVLQAGGKPISETWLYRWTPS